MRRCVQLTHPGVVHRSGQQPLPPTTKATQVPPALLSSEASREPQQKALKVGGVYTRHQLRHALRLHGLGRRQQHRFQHAAQFLRRQVAGIRNQIVFAIELF